jgi:hypothetical protein
VVFTLLAAGDPESSRWPRGRFRISRGAADFLVVEGIQRMTD